MIEGIATVWIPVSDMQQALGFYRDTLGLDELRVEEQWSEVGTGGLKIGLNSREKEQGQGVSGGPVIAFKPQGGLEQAVEALKDKGVPFPGEISEHPWGRIATFQDPDGNDLQLYEAPSE